MQPAQSARRAGCHPAIARRTALRTSISTASQQLQLQQQHPSASGRKGVAACRGEFALETADGGGMLAGRDLGGRQPPFQQYISWARKLGELS